MCNSQICVVATFFSWPLPLSLKPLVYNACIPTCVTFVAENCFQKKFGNILNEELDEHGCPQQKVALLCGSPGLGKTTLAHMVGTHAGYNVVELNASDDRSPDVFRTQLETATQMRSMMGTEPRPNCLVLDEIDGAPAVSFLPQKLGFIN
jgi:hypothetical protein